MWAEGRRGGCGKLAALTLIIFDCDGVLVDSERIANRVLAEHLTRAGLPLSMRGSVERFMGLSRAGMLGEAERQLGRALPETFASDYEVARRRALERELRAVSGMRAVASAAPSRCVASSGACEVTRHSLGIAGLLDLFEGRIFSATQVARGKPAPDLFLYAASCMGVEAASCTVVEDSLPGVRAGIAAGMRVIGLADLVPAAELATAGAEVVHSAAELALRLGLELPRALGVAPPRASR